MIRGLLLYTLNMSSKYIRMNPTLLLLIVLIVAGLWSLGSWLVVRNIEEPSYTVVEKRDGYEIRDYAPYIVAEVEVTGSRDQSMSQ